MIRKSIDGLTLDTEFTLSATLRGTAEPGDTTEEIAIRDLADLTAAGAVVTRVYERDPEGGASFQYRITVDRLLRYECAWGDPTAPVAEAAWRQGYRGRGEMEMDSMRAHLRRLWRERYAEDLPLDEESLGSWEGIPALLSRN